MNQIDLYNPTAVHPAGSHWLFSHVLTLSMFCASSPHLPALSFSFSHSVHVLVTCTINHLYRSDYISFADRIHSRVSLYHFHFLSLSLLSSIVCVS
jgi:hypothetical protein